MSRNTDPIRDRLVADAEGMSPRFSESLHVRTVAAMRKAQTRRRAADGGTSWWRTSGAIAAALAVAVTGWWLYSRPDVIQIAPTRTAMVIGVDVNAPQPGELIVKASLERLTPPAPPIGSIERQVRAAAQYVAEQFPPSMVEGTSKRM